MNKLGLYLIRWQLSSPILWIAMMWLSDLPVWAAVVVANIIGGLMFYYVDKRILCN